MTSLDEAGPFERREDGSASDGRGTRLVVIDKDLGRFEHGRRSLDLRLDLDEDAEGNYGWYVALDRSGPWSDGTTLTEAEQDGLRRVLPEAFAALGDYVIFD